MREVTGRQPDRVYSVTMATSNLVGVSPAGLLRPRGAAGQSRVDGKRRTSIDSIAQIPRRGLCTSALMRAPSLRQRASCCAKAAVVSCILAPRTSTVSGCSWTRLSVLRTGSPPSPAEIIETFGWHVMVELPDGRCRRPTPEECYDPDGHLPKNAHIYRRMPLDSQGVSATGRSGPCESDVDPNRVYES